MVSRIAFKDGLSHDGARVNSCMAHVIARHRADKNHRLTWFCLFVCGFLSLRVNISGTSRVTAPVCRVLVQYYELPKETGDCSRDARGDSVHLPLLRSRFGWWQETKLRMATACFSGDASCCSSRVNIRGRSHVVAVT